MDIIIIIIIIIINIPSCQIPSVVLGRRHSNRKNNTSV
jgi:hypothetical protein